ncbi:hypothetical protein D8Y22_11835 [Salinadaptatus halalkaliphilus]|uniref:Big-1 domain-containing protein n=1 Tax=Salinadaptatus halalkaliphilus TaxID=2419781 RepID=A0A4V3VLB6_9EURY|nr:GLUG motif-containing protein [Salinadaptatus halalkaliphilus]THE64687.1 hypothetical protein D8Y22_11835 [Salinadaptatus halalkaliphilus]
MSRRGVVVVALAVVGLGVSGFAATAVADSADIDGEESDVDANPATVGADSTHEFTIELEDGSEIGEIAEFEFYYTEGDGAGTSIDGMDDADVTIEVNGETYEDIDTVSVATDESVEISLDEAIQVAADASPSDPTAVESGQNIVVFLNNNDAGEITNSEAVETEDIEVTLTESDGSTSDSTTVSFDTNGANSVEVETDPEDTIAGDAISGNPEAKVTDESGNPVEGVEVTVEAQGVEGGGIDAGETEVDTDDDGIATFDDLEIEDADEGYELEFSIDTEGNENVEDGDDETTDPFDVEPADADTITEFDIDDEEFAYDDGSTTVTVQAEDEFGNPVEYEDDALTLDIDGAVYSDSVTNVDISDGDAEVTIDDQDAPSDLDTAVGELTVTAEAADTGNTESGTLTVYPDFITVSFTDSEADADEEAVTDLDLELEDSDGNTLADDEVDQIDVEYTLFFKPDDYDDEATLAEQTLTGESITIEDVTEATDTWTFAATRADDYAIEGDVQPAVTEGATQSNVLTVNPVLDDFTLDDVTIEQGDELEVEFSDAVDLAGETFGREEDVTVDVDDLTGVDDPKTVTVDFDSDGASTDLVLDGSQTVDVSAGTYEDIDASADDVSAVDSFTVTVEVPVDSVTATIDGDEAPTATTGKTVAVDVTVEDENGDAIEDKEIEIDALDDGGEDVTVEGLSESDTATTDSDGVATFEDIVFSGEIDGTVEVTTSAEDDTADTMTVTVGGFGAGNGSATDPYVIEDWDHLDNVRENLDSEFVLANDLDQETEGYDDVASETANGGDGFEPIGEDGNEFTGTFDGQGNEIVGLFIGRSPGTFDGVGLFGNTDGALITEVALEDVDVNSDDQFAGGLVGDNDGTITGSSVTGTVNGDSDVGGLVGRSGGGTITESHASGIVTGSEVVGGLLGHNGGAIEKSSATGDVTGSDDFVGGLVGRGGTITESHATGTVIGDQYVGGLVGDSGDVTKSYATGDVTGTEAVGGLVGGNAGDVTESYATSTVNGSDSEVGGLVGDNEYGEVSESYWDDEAAAVIEAGVEQDELSDGGEPLETDEMTGANAPEHMDGFAFTDTWHATDSYPALAWEDTDPFYAVTLEETNAPIDEGVMSDGSYGHGLRWASNGRRPARRSRSSSE